MAVELPFLVKLSIGMLLYRNGMEQRSILDAHNNVAEVHVGSGCRWF